MFTTLRKSMHNYKKITTNFLKQGRGWQSKANRTFLEFCPFGRARASLNFEGNSYSSTGLWAGLNFNLILPDLVSWELLSSYVDNYGWNWTLKLTVKCEGKTFKEKLKVKSWMYCVREALPHNIFGLYLTMERWKSQMERWKSQSSTSTALRC